MLNYEKGASAMAVKSFKPLQNGAVLCCWMSTLTAAPASGFQTPSERGGIVLI